MSQVILASASPRRADLLRQLGLTFEVLSVDIDEIPLPDELPEDYVSRLAKAKARAGFTRAGQPEALVVGSDTSVILDGHILGKPASRGEAIDMLSRLSGQWHQVMTGVALATEHGTQVALSATDVEFRSLDEREIAAYCDTGEPMDKAGGYGIQGRGGAFVRSLRGSYSAVVGLPLDVTSRLLAQAGLPSWNYWKS